MAGKTDAAEGIVLDLFTMQVAPTVPTSLDVALFTTDPGEGGAGTEVPTSTGGATPLSTGYGRINVLCGGATPGWQVGLSTNQRNNVNELLWNKAINQDWGNITHVGVFNGTTMLYYGPLTAAKLIAIDDTFRIPAGELVLSED